LGPALSKANASVTQEESHEEVEEGTGMRTFVKAGIALTTLFTSTLLAVSDDVPVLNTVPVCRGIASQAANPTEKGGPDLDFKDCISSEQEVRVQLAKVWSTFQPADKGHCIRLTQTGGESSYTELITCLEMAQCPFLTQQRTSQDV
jgi:hypothetical protein